LVPTSQVVFVDKFFQNIQDFDPNIFRVRHGHIKIEVLEVDAVEACALLREYTVKENLDQLEQSCVGSNISRVTDLAATDGDPCTIWVILVRTNFTNN
jgi:hypothetical protein